MILVSNSAAQTLTPGQSITFDTVLLKTGDAECCRNNAARAITAAKMRRCGNYMLAFQANIASPTAATAVQLSIQVADVTLPETTATFTPVAADTEFGSVYRSTVVTNACNDVTTVAVTNTGTIDVIVAPDASLFVRRMSGGAD